MRNIGRIILNRVMAVYLNAELSKPVFERLRRGLTGVSRYDNAPDIKTYSAESVDKP